MSLFAFHELRLKLKAVSDIFDWSNTEVFALPRRLLQLDCLFELQVVHLPLEFAQFRHSFLQEIYLPLLGPYPIVVLVDDSVDVAHEVLLEAGNSQLLDFLA